MTKKITFFTLVFVLAFIASACEDPTPTVSPIATPTPFQSPLEELGIVGGPMPREEIQPMDAIDQFWLIVIEAVQAKQLRVLLGLILLNLVAAVTDAVHRDWCVEHGVPESQCGQCDAKLAAEFQQKGDWCEEHNRPESQCFICRPDAEAKFAAVYEAKFGEKPPKPTE